VIEKCRRKDLDALLSCCGFAPDVESNSLHSADC
jgi:hypothetical protein